MSGERLTPHIEVVGMDDGFLLFDDRLEAKDNPLWFDKLEDVARYVSDNSTEAEYYPIGDWLKEALSTVGIKKPCLPCAKRQAKLNRLLHRTRQLAKKQRGR